MTLYYEGWALFVLVLLGIVAEIQLAGKAQEPRAKGVMLAILVLIQLWVASVIFRMLLEVKK